MSSVSPWRNSGSKKITTEARRTRRHSVETEIQPYSPLDVIHSKHGTVYAVSSVSVRLPSRRQNYEIKIGPGLLPELGQEIRACLGSDPRRIALISNSTVFRLFGARSIRSLRAAHFDVSRWLMPDGEQHKSLRSLEQALTFLSQSGLERNDGLVALGGGVDFTLTHRLALRVQPDYLQTDFFSNTQKNFRISTGLVFKFGNK